ncbi:MAG: S8 family serine peptidase, partial [Burkholderiales bacterium]|nr:S8 family serine peptidase [Burkholderiales bacterium]
MKKFTLVLVLVLLVKWIQAQDTYYWYADKQKELSTISNRMFVLVKNANDTMIVKRQIENNGYNVEPFKQITINIIPFRLSTIPTNYWTIIEAHNTTSNLSDTNIDYSAPFFLTQDSTVIGLSHLFYVKLKNSDDVILLESIAKENNVSILGNNQYMPLWFTLSCSKESTGNALQMANLFYESKLFSASEPDILVDNISMCVNDTCFSNQWGLNNTGQYNGIAGIDINYCEAHQITAGDSNVIVAVLDHGVELNHPDLTNMYPISYDTESGTSPSQLRGYGNHGTACAGIIGATVNNDIGIAGIAPLSPIMSISHSLAPYPNERQDLANGINFACNNNASVISNSWGANALVSPIIDSAINNALVNGRNGKGTVVVFSSGNNNDSSVLYPSYLDGVISVGAISPCGERKSPTSCDTEIDWGSNYGTGLSIVAPGVLIPTTDNQNGGGYNPSLPIHTMNSGTLLNQDYTNADYTIWFAGTSAACPHVSGVAALILSVNPCLNKRDVKDIIEQTAQKIRPDLYTYSNNPCHPNGTWNIEMGHGLLDAYAAVLKAQELYSSTLDLYIKDRHEDLGISGGYYWQADRDNPPDVWVRNQADGRTNQVHE